MRGKASKEAIERELNEILYGGPYTGVFFTGKKAHAEVLARALAENRIAIWNNWRARNRELIPNLRGIRLARRDLREANFSRTNLAKADLYRADLERAKLQGSRLVGANLAQANLRYIKGDDANLSCADLSEAHLERARLRDVLFLSEGLDTATLEWADLREADMRGAIMRGAKLIGADFRDTNLDGADLRKAELDLAVLAGTSLKGAHLDGASVQRVLVQNIFVDEETTQRNLEADWNMWMTRPGWLRAEDVTVNDLRVAHFTNLLQQQAAVAHLINAGCTSVILLLGRFTPTRKRILDKLGNALRQRGKTPILFDFPGPDQRELTDTVRFIAGLAQFVVVDLTKPSSVPLELQAIIPEAMVPVVPIVQSGHEVFPMFKDLQRRYSWVLRPVHYKNSKQLLRYVDDAIIGRAEAMQAEIQLRRKKAAKTPASITRAK